MEFSQHFPLYLSIQVHNRNKMTGVHRAKQLFSNLALDPKNLLSKKCIHASALGVKRGENHNNNDQNLLLLQSNK